jgi:hypothetical protein
MLGYLMMGLLYARSQAVAVHQRTSRAWSGMPTTAREAATMQLAWRVVLWPYAIWFDALRGPLRRWLFAPVNDRKERAEQLRKDAASWREKLYSGTPAERAMARELVQLCEERAKEVDL